ncbi:Peptidase [Oryctes borbonicus]|uniref:Peptidase n=1 Tax=Oryctes borbonicus TaxID=1629725 RepID=A0A0T6B021_9SCAR|nr:Peptidase [Oryctes borbonicus]
MSSQQGRQTKKKPNRTSTPRSRTSIKNSRANTLYNTTMSENQSLVQSRNPAPRPPKQMNRSVTQQAASVSRLTQQPQPNSMPSSQQSSQNPEYVIQPHGQHIHQQQPVALPSYVPSNQIKKIIESTPLTEEYTDSIRMLVLLSTGEQRLITFTLPKEQCTIQEILEQVGVPIEPETKIECNETNMNGINYIVTVTMPQHAEQSLEEAMDVEDVPFQSSTSSSQKHPSPISEDPPKPPTPEPPKEQPKYIQGMLAVCSHCGYLSEDFNKCLRCKRKLPEDVKSVATADQSAIKKNDNKVCPIPEKLKPSSAVAAAKANGTPKLNATSRKKVKSKTTEQEPIILTLSSDEEEDSNKPQNVTLKIVESQLMPEIKKEPSFIDIQKCDKELICDKNSVKEDNSQPLTTAINCRTIRIGSYRFVPSEDIVVNSSEVIIKVPLPNDPKEIRTITIEKTKIVKVLANFQKMLPVIFYYVIPSCSGQIREQLNMTVGSEYYFDSISTEEAFRRITILPEHIGDDTKIIFKQIYGKPLNIMDELTSKEANNILLKTCPKEITKAIGITSCFTEIRHLLSYPPGSGGLPINTEDYMCLAQDQFLNDVIIDFYLKYLVLNLPEEKKEKVHVFSTFFYKRLTTKPLKGSRRAHPLEADSSLTAAQKRHARVKNWTKNVNLFEKDFIIIPINESCHWFLAIICFPGTDGCYTFDGKLVKLESKQKKKKSNTAVNVTVTQAKVEKVEGLPCEDGDASDKDEAEGDDSELESEEDVDDVQLNNMPIKQPCILIFDSLAGASRSRVVATLRDYLTCEYRIKMSKEKIFNKDTIKCACPKVPQQTNFTDCGLYLLQYVESFFNDPIKNYRLPIHQLKNWFEEMTVTRKREDISKLIKELMTKYNKDPGILPEIVLPTLNGMK